MVRILSALKRFLAYDGNSKWVMEISCLLALMVSGCVMGKDYLRPEVELPPSWAAVKPEGDKTQWPDSKWWTLFSDPQLDRLIQAAMEGSFDLKAAMSRIEQARAVVKVSGANLYPSLNASGDAARFKSPDSANNGGSRGMQTALELSLVANYELDIWGKYRRLQESAQAGLWASIYDRKAIELTLAGDVATVYLQLLSLSDRLEIANETVALEKRTLDIIEKRYRSGLTTALDLAQSRSNLAAVESSVFATELAYKQSLNALCILLGKPPGGVDVHPKSLMQTPFPAVIPQGLPSELLERRPDIKRAEAELAGANADVGAAKAAMFPSIALTATGGYANQEVANLIRPDSAFYSLASGLLAPIFQGGRLSGEYERTLARHEELVQGYRQTIVAAFRDVKDALAAIEKLDLQESAQTEAVAQAWVAHRLALLRYEAGQVDYLAVLITDRGLLNARNALVDIRLGRLAAFVDLYQALGGGWVDEANGSTPS